jgi:hypothetical protein
MTPCARILSSALLAVLALAAEAVPGTPGTTTAVAQTPGVTPAPPVDIRTSLSRTAVWVGDRVSYVVELRCAPQVDILLDDLAKERLRVDGGDVESAEAERRENDGRVIHTMRYTLTTYRVDAPELRVAPIPVRYFARRPGQRADEGSPAGEVTIAPLVIAVRSTLPESAAAIALRPSPSPRPAPAYLRWAQPVGLGLILIAIVPVSIWSLDLERRRRRARTSHVASPVPRRPRGSFELIKALEPASEVARIEAFDQLDGFLRDHLHATTGIATHALTPAEIRRALDGRAPRLPHDDAERVLAVCERARYGPEPPSADDWADAVRQAEQVLRERQ